MSDVVNKMSSVTNDTMCFQGTNINNTPFESEHTNEQRCDVYCSICHNEIWEGQIDFFGMHVKCYHDSM